MIDYDTIRVAGDVNVDLSLRRVSPTDSYILREADGITAPEFNMQIANTLYQGGVFQNRQSLNRQVVLNIRLNPNYGAGETVKSLRQNLYRMLSTRWNRALKVQLLLAGSVIAEIEGYISNMAMNPFAKEPEVQVTIDCLSPCWFAPTPVNYLPETPDDLRIDYLGSAPVGFLMQLQFTEYRPPTSAFVVQHEDNVLEKIALIRSFNVGDILTIDTRPGSRSVTVTTGAGSPISILANYTKDSKWLQIYEGLNNFSLNTNKFTWLGVQFTPQWWGA